MFYTIIMLLIIGAVVAMVGTEGAWSAALMLINTITAALLAMNFWEPLAALGIGYSPGTEFFIDFFLLTSLFAIIVMVLRTITDKLSRKRPLLPKLADTIGGFFLAAWTGWILVCFFSVALQTAPLARNFFGFEPEANNFIGLGPDRVWLGFTQRMSNGPLMPLTADTEDPAQTHVFDPRGEFIIKYATHRSTYATPTSVEAGISGVMITE